MLHADRAISLCSLFLLLLLSGCGSDVTVDAELYAQDGFLQTLRRSFQPESYWESKVAALEVAMQVDQIGFKKRNSIYRKKLRERRKAVLIAVNQAEAAGKDPRGARRAAIEKYRSKLDPLRSQTRDMGRQLRHRMRLLGLAREALNRAR